MDLKNKIDQAWEWGAQGTEEVPLQPGIQYVFNVVRRKEELEQQKSAKKEQEGQSK